jgi:RimJ/RimL family protein N-acetyltransferase
MPPLPPKTILHANAAEAEQMRAAVRDLRELNTARLRLRPLTFNDVNNLTSLLVDPAVSSWVYLFEQPFIESAAHKWIAKSMDLQEAGEGVFLAVEYLDNGFLIGEMHLDCWPDHKSAEYGGLCAKPFWGKGFAEEAGVALNDFLFDEAACDLITMTTSPNNRSAQRIIDLMQFTPMGERDCIRPDGSNRPSLYFELTCGQWQGVRKKFLADRPAHAAAGITA